MYETMYGVSKSLVKTLIEACAKALSRQRYQWRTQTMSYLQDSLYEVSLALEESQTPPLVLATYSLSLYLLFLELSLISHVSVRTYIILRAVSS